mmetsp:Transcript_16211/g.32639  ORF Transcript_16211/g.32639 Transcript_16211/m.32639 type:complete len:100 (+) Transcript_16211:541-840(+)
MEEYVNVKVKGTEQRTRYSCSKVNALWFRGGNLVSPMTMEASLHYFLFIISNLSDSLNIKQHTCLSEEVASGPPNVNSPSGTYNIISAIYVPAVKCSDS